MKIRVLSDLHIDVGGHLQPTDQGEDVVVLAGDIAEGIEGLEWAVRAFPTARIVSVLGNHEFYGREIGTFVAEYRDAARALGGDRIDVLENGAIVIDGVRFVGATLWTDFKLYGESVEALERAFTAARKVMVDYRQIAVADATATTGQRLLTPEDTIALHYPSLRYLALALTSGDPAKTVVVTHHAPHRGSLAPQWADDLVSAGFVSNLGHMMGRAKYWIHGHTHTSFDYAVNGTRVLCNPRGYCTRDGLRCENPEFNWNLVVEI
jgi:predicted phosphodiesterase